jgi:hypothetical protein
MVKKKQKKTTRTTREAPEKLKGARLAEAKRVAREAAAKHPRGVLSLPGVGKPKDPKADVWVLQAGPLPFRIVLGLSDEGKAWIARQADHSEGYEGEPMFGAGAYKIDASLVTPLKRGLDAAGLTVTP